MYRLTDGYVLCMVRHRLYIEYSGNQIASQKLCSMDMSLDFCALNALYSGTLWLHHSKPFVITVICTMETTLIIKFFKALVFSVTLISTRIKAYNFIIEFENRNHTTTDKVKH